MLSAPDWTPSGTHLRYLYGSEISAKKLHHAAVSQSVSRIFIVVVVAVLVIGGNGVVVTLR